MNNAKSEKNNSEATYLRTQVNAHPFDTGEAILNGTSPIPTPSLQSSSLGILTRTMQTYCSVSGFSISLSLSS